MFPALASFSPHLAPCHGQDAKWGMEHTDNKPTDDPQGEDQLQFKMNSAIRALWFLFVGWWLVWIWLSVAILLMCTVVGWPLAYKMFDSTYTVITLDVD